MQYRSRLNIFWKNHGTINKNQNNRHVDGRFRGSRLIDVDDDDSPLHSKQ